jgi:hypothetical protein
MVKHLEEWQCEVCRKTYKTQERAAACESVVPSTYPVGCMYAHYKGGINDTYAVATNRACAHENNGFSWCSQDEDAHKKFIGHKHTCIDGSGLLKLGRFHRHAELELPSCERMVEWLESQGITPTVWDGSKAVSLEAARANPQAHWRYKTGFGTYPRRRR